MVVKDLAEIVLDRVFSSSESSYSDGETREDFSFRGGNSRWNDFRLDLECSEI